VGGGDPEPVKVAVPPIGISALFVPSVTVPCTLPRSGLPGTPVTELFSANTLSSMASTTPTALATPLPLESALAKAVASAGEAAWWKPASSTNSWW
jgi:hypothetical protein